MRKKLCFLLLLCIALTLCACGEPERSDAQKEAAVTAISDELIRCLSEKDRDSFVALFSQQAQSDPSFAEQVDAVFGFFETDTYTRSKYLQFDWSTQAGWGSPDREAFSASVVYIQDPTPLPDGTPWHWFYELQIDYILTCREDDTEVCIRHLTVIRSNDGLTFKIGIQE